MCKSGTELSAYSAPIFALRLSLWESINPPCAPVFAPRNAKLAHLVAMTASTTAY
jgi:hypothetical protein